MIIVTGGTGRIGSQLVAQLKQSQHGFRVVARNPKAAVQQLGDVEIVPGDLDQPDTLTDAFAGGTALFLLSPHGPAMVAQQLAAIIAAQRAGIRRIVKLSGTASTIHRDAPSHTSREHWLIEQALEASGVEYTILRANMFMQNLLDFAAPMVAAGKPLVMPLEGDLPVCYVDTRDIAECALRCLTEAQHANRTYDVSGARSSFDELATVLTDALEHRVKYVRVPLRLALGVQRLKGASPWLVEHQREMLTLFQKGASASDSDAIRDITGRAPRDIAAFVQDTLPQWSGQPSATSVR